MEQGVKRITMTRILILSLIGVLLVACLREGREIGWVQTKEPTDAHPLSTASAARGLPSETPESAQPPREPSELGAKLGICGAQPGQLFSSDYPFNRRVDSAPLDAESSKIVQYLQENHKNSQRFRIDGASDEPDNKYGMTLLAADSSTPHLGFTRSQDFYSPDCDPSPLPLPAGGAVEGEASFACTGGGDCHLLVIDVAACRLHEMWRTDASRSVFRGGCQAVWDLRAPYKEILRGECCTSADAGGLPIAAQMFSADDIAEGEIRHAIRFTLPNRHIRRRVYVRPATHATPATSGPPEAPPYGVRLRLNASFDDSHLKPAARVVTTGLRRYGMILSDGGNVTFTATNDRFTKHKWRDVGLGPNDLTPLRWSDFEVPELGARKAFDNACTCKRTPLGR